jgi:nitrite reductase/ring-hydroxylating ferredoxin subunit
MPFVRVGKMAQLPHETLAEARVGDRELVLVHHNGQLRAFDGECPHAHGPLGQGNLADGRIICPWHGWEFDALSGQCVDGDDVQLRRHEVTVRDGEIWIEID